MAFTNLLYDPCATKKRTEESTSVLSYLMDANKYYNPNPCRIEMGTVGGNNVSLYEGNMVDLESDLRGQTRVASQCPSNYYLPGTVVQGRDVKKCTPDCGADGLPCGNAECRRKKLVHLPSCKMVDYKPRQQDKGYELNYEPPCAASKSKSKPKSKSSNKGFRANLFSPIEWQGQQGVEQWPKSVARY